MSSEFESKMHRSLQLGEELLNDGRDFKSSVVVTYIFVPQLEDQFEAT